MRNALIVCDYFRVVLEVIVTSFVANSCRGYLTVCTGGSIQGDSGP